MSLAVSVKNITCSFGELKAVDDLSFEIESGQVLGFIGANGAGKTTTMRMMATLEHQDEGVIEICGHDTLNEPHQVRASLGWMPDHFGAYSYMSVFEYLDFYARAFGFTGRDRRVRVEEVMEFCDLNPLHDRLMDKLSKGMTQRLCLGRTLLHDPEVMILDEPAAGLDPKARLEFKRLVSLLADEGKTLFISSHILSELEEMCTSLLFIDKGRIIHQGSSESLKRDEKNGAEVVVQVLESGASLIDWIDHHPGVLLVEENNLYVRCLFENGDQESLAAALRTMIQDGVAVVEFRRQEKRLEDAFIDILGEQR